MNTKDVLRHAKGFKTPFAFRTYNTDALSVRLNKCFAPLSITLPKFIERPNIPQITEFSYGKLTATALDMDGAFMRSNIRNTTSCHRIDRVYADYAGNTIYATHRAFSTVLVTTGAGETKDYYNLRDHGIVEDEADYNDGDVRKLTESDVFGKLDAESSITGVPVFVFNMVLGYTASPYGVTPTVLLFRPYGDMVSQANQTFFWFYIAHLQSLGIKVALLNSSAEWTKTLFKQCADYGKIRSLFVSVTGTAPVFNEIPATPRFYPDGTFDMKVTATGEAYVHGLVTIVPPLLPSSKKYIEIATETALDRTMSPYDLPINTFGRASLSHGRTNRLYLANVKYLIPSDYNGGAGHYSLGNNLALVTEDRFKKLALDKSGATYVEWYVQGMLYDGRLERHCEPRIVILVPKNADSYLLAKNMGMTLKSRPYTNWEEFCEDCKKAYHYVCAKAGINPETEVVVAPKPEVKKTPPADTFPFSGKSKDKWTTDELDVVNGYKRLRKKPVVYQSTDRIPDFAELLEAFAVEDEVIL